MATDNLGFPFDSLNHDRTMSSGSWRKLFKSFFTNGIFKTDDFYVSANNAMEVKVGTGHACINGAFYPLETETTLKIDSSNGTYDRYDAIVIEFNLTDRQFYVKVVKGSSDSKYPTPIRTDSVYQLYIAVVKVGKGVTALTQDNINDTRADSWYCGYVTSTGSQERFEAELSNLKRQVATLEESRSFGASHNIDTRYGVTLNAKWNDTFVEFEWYGTLSQDLGFTGGSEGYKFGNNTELQNIMKSHTAVMFSAYDADSNYPIVWKYDTNKNGFSLFTMKNITVPKNTWISGTHIVLR